MVAHLMHRLGLFKLLERVQICDFETDFRKLNATCYVSPEISELRIWMTLKEMRQTLICGK